MTAEMKLFLLISSFMFSLNIMLCTLTKCSVAVLSRHNPCFSAAVSKWLLFWRAVVSITVISHVQHSGSSSDVFPPVSYLSDGTLIKPPVFRNSFVRLSNLGRFNNSSLGWSKKCFPFNHFTLKAKIGSRSVKKIKKNKTLFHMAKLQDIWFQSS